jgi:hypothetical protein
MGQYGAQFRTKMEGEASMTDGDPFGRRSGRRPDDRNYSQPWNDEGALDDPYVEPAPDTRRSRPARQPRGGEQPYGTQQPYPYRESESRYPAENQPGNWGRGDEQPAWPERPYANPEAQRSTQQDPYGRQPDYGYDDQEVIEDVDTWGEPPQRGARRREVVQRTRAARPPIPRPTIPPAISAALAGQDSRLLLTAAGALLSLAVMAIVTVTRVDALPDWFPLHLDASGEVTKWGTNSALWRLPFGLAMLTVMNIASAIVLGLREQRLAWILIGSLPLIHVIAWIALILIGW